MAINTGLSKILGEKIGVTRVTSISLKAKDTVQLATTEIRSHFVIKSKDPDFASAESTSPNSTVENSNETPKMNRSYRLKIQILEKIYTSFAKTTLYNF